MYKKNIIILVKWLTGVITANIVINIKVFMDCFGDVKVGH